MPHALSLLCAALLAPTDPGELSVTSLHGGWLRALHGSTTSRTVWVGGDGGLIQRSVGNGDSFVVEPTPSDPALNVQLEGLFLIDVGAHAGRGLAVGTDRTILRRDPDNATWSQVDPGVLPAPVTGTPTERLTDVVLLDGGRDDGLDVLLGWVVGEDGVLWHLREEYRDGDRVSESWRRQDGRVALLEARAEPSARSLFSVHVVHGATGAPDAAGPLHLYAGGDWGLLLHSTNHGESWTQLDVPGRGQPGGDPTTCFDVQDVVVRPDGRGAAVGGAWVRGKPGWAVGIHGFTEVRPNTLGASGCAPAVTCAAAWDVSWRGSVSYGVCALPDGRFLAVAYGSDTWRSPRDGTRWLESTYKPLPSAERPLTPPLREVALVGSGDDAALYIVGHHGTVRRALDPDATPLAWEQPLGQFVVRVKTGDFINDQQGWIAGVSGPIVATSDAGRSFNVVCEAAGGSVMALDMLTNDSGVGVGYQPDRRRGLRPYVVYRDTSGWHEHDRGRLPGVEAYSGELTDVHVSDGRFWIVGSDGFVGWSDDGGARWNDASVPRAMAARLEAVAALDRERVLVAGRAGIAALRVTSGDTTRWEPLPVRASSDDGRLVIDGVYTGDLMALGHDDASGRTVAVGSGGYVFELDLAARALVEVHRDDAGRDLTEVGVAPDGSVFASGTGSTFLWHDALANSWQPANSRSSMGLEAIVPTAAGEGYLIGGQSQLKRYTVER